VARNSEVVVTATLWVGERKCHCKALLQPLHTLQFLSQLVDSPKPTVILQRAARFAGVDSTSLHDKENKDSHGTSNRNEYQESSWGIGRPARKADNLTAICEPIV
jgi:hypothetical protein